MQMEQPEDREQVINVIDEITDDFSLTSKKLLQKETLSQNEYKLIEKYRKLSTTEKQLIDQTISTLNSK